MGSQHGVVGPTRNFKETWSSELMLTVLGTWHVLIVPYSDLAVGVESGLPQETHHMASPVAWWVSLLASLPC